jgi:hypothetical protein
MTRRARPLCAVEVSIGSARAVSLKLWLRFESRAGKFREVLDCGSPLPPLHGQPWPDQSGRGLPQSRTLARVATALSHLAAQFENPSGLEFASTRPGPSILKTERRTKLSHYPGRDPKKIRVRRRNRQTKFPA